jgi:hypothetical protein
MRSGDSPGGTYFADDVSCFNDLALFDSDVGQMSVEGL